MHKAKAFHNHKTLRDVPNAIPTQFCKLKTVNNKLPEDNNQVTVGDTEKFRIPFRRTAVARLKKRGKKTVRRLLKTAVPFDHVTVLIFLVHRMSRSKKCKKSFIQ